MKIYNMTEIKSLQKQRFGARQLIAVCLVLVMFFGTAFDYAIAFSERQNLDFALESDRYDLLVDHDELFDLSHWQLEDNELTELPPGILEALLREQEEYFALSSRVREKAIFLELLDEGLRFSDLTEANRFFVFRQLDIACAAQETVKQLFEQMESDGFSLAESIELVRIISSGVFDYEEAQIIFNTIPSTLERLIEVVYFEQFVQMFDVADKINARRLINMPFYSTNEFKGLYILIEEIREEEKEPEGEIKEEEPKEETVELPPAEETTDPPPINGDSQEPKETEPPITCEDTSMNGGNLPNDDEKECTLDESGSVAHEQELMAGKRAILFEEHSSYLEEHISYSEEYFVDVDDDQIYREEDELILEEDEDYPINQEEDLILEDDNPIIEDDEDYPAENYEREQLEDVYSSRVMLADSAAFELARQMFLDNPLMIEIEATFMYGEILFSDLRVNLSEQEREHILLQRQSASYTSPEALANLLFADVFFTSEDQYLRYLGELMFPHFKVKLAGALAYIDFDEYGNIIDYELSTLDYNMYQAITPMSTIDHGDIVSSPFALRFNANESVSLNTGASMYRVNILSLPGRNGFNLNLDMVYSSTRAYSNGHGAISVLRNLHGLGEGWIFDLPYIWDNVLYVPGRGSFALSGNTILEYTLHDMRLFHDTTFLSGTIRSDRRLTFHNGTSYFFNGAHVIGMVDRFGNTIRFEYANVSGFNNLRLLSRIVDTNGRVVSFTYNALSESRTVTVTSPDNSTFVINMTRNAQLPTNAFLVSSIRNQVGAVTGFTYRDERVDLHFTNKNPSAAGLRTDTAWLLSRVTYPAGAQLRFDYDRHNINLGRDGSRHLWRVSSRTLYNNGREYLRTTFGYEGDHTAFPQRVDRPPATHTYSTTVTQNNGVHTVYTFNYRHMNTLQRTYNAENVLLLTQVMTYNNDRLPILVETAEGRNNLTRSTRKEFTYNRYGQLTQVVSPLAQGSSHERYRIDYTFDARFGLPLTRTSRPNATTIIVERNTLSTDGMRVLREYVYENNVRKSRTDFFHDTYGNVTEIREFYGIGSANFIQTQITYNSGTMPSLIRRTGVRDANGTLVGNIDRRFTYDTMWRTLSETDPLGAVTRWQYDRIGRITRIDFPSGGFTTYTYDDRRNTLTHRTVLGAIYTYQYSGLGKLVSVTVGGVEILRNFYDTRMRIIETRNTQGIGSSQRTVFTYDVFNRETLRRSLSSTGAELYRESTLFSDIFDAERNRRITTTFVGTGHTAIGNAPNIQTFVLYDRFGRRTQESTIGGRIITFTHDLAGRVITEQSLGVRNTFTYNVHGVTSVRNILGYTAQNTYDMLGRLVSSTDFMGNTQRFTYDALGRLISHRIPFERIGTTVHYSEVRYFYDRNSNITRQSTLVNAPGQAQVWATTENTFRHNRLISSTTGGANGIRTEYTYDLAGNVLTKTVGGATTTFEYNNRGRLISTTDALGQTETFTHDANGHVITHVDRNGTTFQMTYNNLGRMTRKEARQNGELVGFRSYAFHPTGALRQVDNGSHVITYYYDAQGRVIRQTETGGIVKTFAYNTANNLTQSRVYVDNVLQSNMTYTFDAAQRVETVAVNGEVITTYTYDANGRRTSITAHTGLRTTYTYNLAGLVTNLTNLRSNGASISRFNYSYYLDGNTRQVVETLSAVGRTITFTYDLARRLTRESATGFEDRTESFTFDNRGNRVSRVVTGTENYTVTYTYDLNNRLLTSTRTPVGGVAEVTTFTHDRNGNQLTKTTGGVTETKTYNAFNQLMSVYIPVSKHAITLTNGGSGAVVSPESAPLGQTVTINAGATPIGHVFADWTSEQNISFANVNAVETTFTMIDEPVTVTANWERVPVIEAGISHSAAIKTDGTSWAWGRNTHGQLGDATFINRYTPVQTRDLRNAVKVSGNLRNTAALSEDGIAWSWGCNQFGQLGQSSVGAPNPTPRQVWEITDGLDASMGTFHGLVLREDSTVWAWGDNANGRLGDGTTTQRVRPVQVQGLTDAIAISAGSNHNVALRKDGTAWAWGSNRRGKLGDGTTIDRHAPVQVQNLVNVIAVSAGDTHTVALREDGTVWAWGENVHGQLGDGTTTNRYTPVLVQSLTNVVAISAGNNYNIALKEDGTVWAWGRNAWGNLGDGTTTSRHTPVQVQNLTDVVAISAGGSHTVALREDGTVWAWGNNANGQLGDGTTNQRPTPVQVLGSNGQGFLNIGERSRPQVPTSPAKLPVTRESTYNRNDNQSTQTLDEVIETNVYNAFETLTNVSTSGMIAVYTYRADGLRHSKTVNGVTATHVWLLGNIVLERNVHGGIIHRFDRSLTGRLIRSPQHGYYLFNTRGDVVQRANAQTSVLRSYRYTAFGVELNPNENNRNPFRFAGEYWDAETGTYYLRARNFNPRTGRFTQPDPHWNIGNMIFGDSPMARHGRMVPSPNSIMQASNLFVYCINNPIRWNDPDGTFIINAIIIASVARTTITVARAHTLGTSVGATSGNDAIRTGFDVIEARRILYRYGIVQPYTQFRTFRGAVYAWSRTYHPQSIDQEWGAWIHRETTTRGVVRYWWDTPVTLPRQVPLAQPKPASAIGWIHTHPHSVGSIAELFSYSDGNWTREFGVPGFLVAPGGRVRKIVPEWEPQSSLWDSETGAGGDTAIPLHNCHVSVFMNLERILGLL